MPCAPSTDIYFLFSFASRDWLHESDYCEASPTQECNAADGKEWLPSADGEEPAAEVAQKITGTSKVCSAIAANNWRDSIVVPNSWSVNLCRTWGSSIGATTYQVGCEFDGPANFSWGPVASIGVIAGAPAANCGW